MFPKGSCRPRRWALLGYRNSAQAGAYVTSGACAPGRPSLLACEQVLAHSSQESLGSRGEAYSRVNDEFTGLGQVLGQQGPPHVTAQCVLEERQERQTPPQ